MLRAAPVIRARRHGLRPGSPSVQAYPSTPTIPPSQHIHPFHQIHPSQRILPPYDFDVEWIRCVSLASQSVASRAVGTRQDTDTTPTVGISDCGDCRHSSVGGGYYGRRRISNIPLGEGVPMSIRIDIRHASPPVQMNIRTG